MVFGSKSTGSKSAQTPSESSGQTASSNPGAAVFAIPELATLGAGTNYRVYHKHRKVGHDENSNTPHHSQIFVFLAAGANDTNGNEVCNLGLFGDNGAAVFGQDDHDANNPYKTSSSYHPNPINATGAQILAAVNATLLQCGTQYKLLWNNCQKFARLVMQNLGATHNRHLFHP